MAKSQFPRRGAWVVVAGALGIIASLGKESVVEVREDDPNAPGKTRPVKKTMLDTDAPFAEVHLVDTKEGPTHGDTTTIQKNVSFTVLRQATFDELRDLKRPGLTEMHPLIAHRAGYTLNNEHSAQIPEWEAAEKANAEAAAKIAAHPDAIALEADIEKERQAFITSVEQRRTEVAARLTSDTKAGS